MARVLVVEDDADLRLMLATALEKSGHTAVISGTGRGGLDLARSVSPDLLLLDLSLPDLSGCALAELLREDPATRHIPFIILSARAGESDRILGLELGADDYVTKPFSVRELLLRVQIALRRSNPPPAEDPSEIRLGPLTIETHDRRALLDGEVLVLTPTEFRLLCTLAGRVERVQSREALLSDVWGVHPGLETRTVDVHVQRLREKLGVAAAMIETVRGVGYRLRRWEPQCPVPSS
jgi:two-component system phosphate regulon response regulator PhoB